MTTYSCKLDLNNAEIMVLQSALEAYIREYDKKNLLQPWNKQPKDLAKAIKKRLQVNTIVTPPDDTTTPTLEKERPTRRHALSAHMRHKRKR